MEWRQWPSGWSFTGTAGINIPARNRRPNTQLFPPNFDPNIMSEPTRSPPCKILIDPDTAGKIDRSPSIEWCRARIKFARETIPKLAGNLNYASVVADLKESMENALTILATLDNNECEDF